MLLKISGQVRLGCRINRLKESLSKNSVVNDRTIQKPAEPGRAINLSAPFGRAGRTKKYEMLEPKERFRFAVALLLFEKSADGKAPVMPDHRGRD